MKDRDDHAARMRQHIIAEAGKHQPGLVSVQVSGNAEAAELGWVWGTHAGANVRVIVGNGLDVSNGQHVLRCIPPDDNHPSDEYYAIGVDWNGVDNSRLPRMMFKGSDGLTFSGAAAHSHTGYASASHTHGTADITNLTGAISAYHFANPFDAAAVTYTPAVATDWDGDADPGDMDDAVDQLAERVDDLETGGGGGSIPYLLYRHTAAQSTAGGTTTAGSDQILPINEETIDTDGIGSLSSNRITLPAGTYRYHCEHVFGRSNTNQYSQIWLYNYTDSADIADSESLIPSCYEGCNCVTAGQFTIADTKEIEIRYRVQTGVATQGFGVASPWREGVFGVYEFWQVG